MFDFAEPTKASCEARGGGGDRRGGPCDSGGRGFRRGAGRGPGLLPGGDGIGLPVSGYYDIPVGIRPVDLRAGILQSAQGLAGRVAVVVARADLNNAAGRLNPAQESRAGRGGAAMVADLQDIALQVVSGSR